MGRKARMAMLRLVRMERSWRSLPQMPPCTCGHGGKIESLQCCDATVIQ